MSVIGNRIISAIKPETVPAPVWHCPGKHPVNHIPAKSGLSGFTGRLSRWAFSTMGVPVAAILGLGHIQGVVLQGNHPLAHIGTVPAALYGQPFHIPVTRRLALQQRHRIRLAHQRGWRQVNRLNAGERHWQGLR